MFAVHNFLPLFFFSLCTGRARGRTGQRRGPGACRRLDGRRLVGKTAPNLVKPTIITHILDGLPEAGAAWSEIGLKKKFKKETITCLQLGGSACYDFDDNQVIHDTVPTNLASLFPRLGIEGDLPGNLFITDKHPVTHELVASLVNRSSATPVLTRALEFVRTPRVPHLSLGREGQWNHMHRHDQNVFVQMTGHKGWVMIPGRNLPKKFVTPSQPRVVNSEVQEGIFDQRTLCSYVMTCQRWMDFANEDRDCSHQAIEEARRNSAVSQYGGYVCDVKQGEAIFVPDGWWHGTCNLAAWNAGFAIVAELRNEEL